MTKPTSNSRLNRGQLRYQSLHGDRESREQAREELKALNAKDIAPGSLVEPGGPQGDNIA